MRYRDESLISTEIKRLVPVLGKETATRLGKAYLLGDETTRKRIAELVDVVKAGIFSDQELRETVLLEPPNRSKAMSGDLDFGNVLYGKKRMYPLKLDTSVLLTHVGIFGSSGYGKTNMSYWIVKQLADRNIPVLIFDFSKKNYRELLQTNLADRIEVFTVGKSIAPFRFNPLQPPEGVQLSQWMKEFSSIFDHAYWLLGGGRHIILKGLNEVFNEKREPVLADLRKWVNDKGEDKMGARERNWLATATRPLESLCFKELGEVFRFQKGAVPSDFFSPGKITVLELDALDTNDKTFFIEIMLQWVRDWLLTKTSREELNGVIILEEAHHILNREKASKMGSETVIELVFREIRELGMGLIYIDQHPSLVSYPALGNTSTQIYMNLGLDTARSSDVKDAAGMLGLSDEDREYMRKLPVGHGFILCRRFGFTDPFLMEFPLVDIKKGAITDRMIEEHMREKVMKIKDAEPEEPVEEEPDEAFAGDVSDQERLILEALSRGDGAFTSQLYQATKMSGSTFKKNAEKLLEKDLIGFRKAKKGKNRLYCYFLKTKARDLIVDPKPKPDTEGLHSTLQMLEDSGWIYRSDGNMIVFEEDASGGKKKKMEMMLLTWADRRGLENAQTDYFICTSPRLKNLAVQYAAFRAWKSGENRPVFVATAKNFSERGKFERIEFF